MPILLVADDEPAVLQLFRRAFEQDGVQVATALSAEQAVHLASQVRPDAVILNALLPDRSALEAYHKVRGLDPRCPVILITAGGTAETAIEAMKQGAFDYLLKPLDLSQVRELVRRAFEVRRLMSEPVQVGEIVGAAAAAGGDALVGRCPAMQEVYKSIGRVAPRDVTVLIRGESGTGKELVARAIYQHSRRAEAPFLVVNCAAIPEALLESELFGYEKGAFTGAERRRIGKFEQCSGGTIFLDEIGDMPLVLQSKILRVLQDQRFERVGGNETIQTDVRIIAATNRDLERMVEKGKFRSDLYYRLNVYSIELPALREKLEDLTLLVHHFLARANQELGREVSRLSPEAMELLAGYSWPGNVRELQSVLKRAVLSSAGPVLLAGFLPQLPRSQQPAVTNHQSGVRSQGSEVRGQKSEARSQPHGETDPSSVIAHRSSDAPLTTHQTHPSPAALLPQVNGDGWDRFVQERIEAGSSTIYDEAVALIGRQVITRVLRQTRGNQVQAARLLGITRSTLRTKIRELGITIGRTIETDQ